MALAVILSPSRVEAFIVTFNKSSNLVKSSVSRLFCILSTIYRVNALLKLQSVFLYLDISWSIQYNAGSIEESIRFYHYTGFQTWITKNCLPIVVDKFMHKYILSNQYTFVSIDES